MSVPGVDPVGEPLEQMVQKASQQAVVLAREQVDVARRELAARARQAGPGAAMVSGGVLLAGLACGTGTAALVLLLARRPGASAAAVGVTGAYAGGGVLLAREGLVRLRETGSSLSEMPVQDDPVQDSGQDLGSAKRLSAGKSPRNAAAKSARQTKSAAKSPRKAAAKSARQTKSAAKSPRKAAAKSARQTKSAAESLGATGRPKPKSKAPSARRRGARTPTP